MGQFEDMAMFVRIVEAGGISRAAEQLDIAKSAVSRRLNDLETRLGTQLISRTTRKNTLTEAGEHYYLQAMKILDEVTLLNEQTSNVKAQVDGTLKMTAPLSFALLHLNSLLDEFINRHAALKLQLDLSDRHVDLIEEGYELAIRIGALEDSSYQAKAITPIRGVLCASPAYLAISGVPERPSDLSGQAFLQYGFAKNEPLTLVDNRGGVHEVAVNSKIKANNGDFMLDMAKRGHGITRLPSFIAYKAIESGELVQVLPQYRVPGFHCYAVYPKNRFLSRRCRLLIDFLSERLGDKPYWDENIV